MISKWIPLTTIYITPSVGLESFSYGQTQKNITDPQEENPCAEASTPEAQVRGSYRGIHPEGGGSTAFHPSLQSKGPGGSLPWKRDLFDQREPNFVQIHTLSVGIVRGHQGRPRKILGFCRIP